MNVNEITAAIIARCGVARRQAEALAAKIAAIEDTGLLEAFYRWGATGEETMLVRGPVSSAELSSRGFIYPNIICCLAEPDRVRKLLDEWH